MVISVNRTAHLPPHQQHLCATAENFSTQLCKFPRKKPKETLDDENTKVTKVFLRQAKHLNDPRITLCQRELLAYTLGINRQTLEIPINEGFEAFASSPPLHRYLAAYGDEVKVSETGEIQLRKGDTHLPWSRLKNEVVIPKRDPVTNQPWLYGPKGIQNKNMFEWTTLEPYKREDPAKWDHKLLFVLCCCCTPNHPNFMGDHTWLEFWLPNGDIISVGLYRGYKHDPKQNSQAPLRVQKGYLMQPDVSRFWPNTQIHEIPFEITQEQFALMKQTIEWNKQKDNLAFQLMGKNCTEYALNIGKIAGIQVPTERPFWELLSKRYIPRPVLNGIKKVSSILPQEINSLCARITTFWLTWPLLQYGAGKIDPTLPQGIHTPHFETWGDCLDPKKQMVKHPHTLGNETRKQITDWRTSRIRELEENQINDDPDIQKKIVDARYARPT